MLILPPCLLWYLHVCLLQVTVSGDSWEEMVVLAVLDCNSYYSISRFLRTAYGLRKLRSNGGIA